jgi:hypothetical protein
VSGKGSGGGEEVKHYQCEGVHKDTLCDDNPCAEIKIWLLELDKGEEVHALIFRLLEQCVDPSVVVIHPPKRPIDRVWVSQAGFWGWAIWIPALSQVSPRP